MPVRAKPAGSRGSRKKQRGAALVETALVFIVVMSMILFIVDMGRILLVQQFIAERARVGVRNAVVNNWDEAKVANFVVYGSPTAPGSGNDDDGHGPGQGQGSPVGLLGLTTSQVTLTKVADSGVGDARYQVTVQGVSLFTWIPYIAGKYNAPPISATAPVQSLGATN
ncbi:MAG TPA: TadE family protein [Bryobacteraceae bacterium]|nr:TadE family protein [Bryobacteraceae bacterium]